MPLSSIESSTTFISRFDAKLTLCSLYFFFIVAFPFPLKLIVVDSIGAEILYTEAHDLLSFFFSFGCVSIFYPSILLTTQNHSPSPCERPSDQALHLIPLKVLYPPGPQSLLTTKTDCE
ncbi:hypothetical protein SLEP1_g42673 [Rubroshorea leprosula]|uniref:Uncharacterized protein n=1 Tax=Rubroshorea leprosula TaxID=152421 RepID=A0AAV5LAP2_9ROSI|nr:hypothetical protein SLEP1_g42673 [Rubroshorea leprosula]